MTVGGRQDIWIMMLMVMMMIVVSVVVRMKQQSASHLCGLCHQFGAIPNSLELLGDWQLSLENIAGLRIHLDSHTFLLIWHTTFLFQKTHIVVVSLWYQDVHLRALGTDDVAVQGVLAQVYLAAFCLVDGNGGNCTQHLQKHDSLLLTSTPDATDLTG